MRTIIVAIAALTATAGPALAQPQVMNSGQGNYRPNSSMGNDGSVQSATQNAEQQFRKMDIHRNGLLTRGEWSAAGLYAPDFAKVDLNNDKRVDLEEYSLAMTGRVPDTASR
jgi:hypothetical protein